MTPTEFAQCRRTLGLTQSELARLLRLAGSGARSIRHYEAGTKPVPGPVSVVLDILANDFDPVAEHYREKNARFSA